MFRPVDTRITPLRKVMHLIIEHNSGLKQSNKLQILISHCKVQIFIIKAIFGTKLEIPFNIKEKDSVYSVNQD